MAILILGKTPCKICGNLITDKTKSVSLPAFVFNECDDLIFFNDASFHENCFHSHHLSKGVEKRVKELMQEVLPENRICSVCQKQINNPDDYLFLGHLLGNSKDELAQFNYMKFHLSCLPKWTYAGNFRKQLENAMRDNRVKGIYYENILRQLELKNEI